MKILQENIQSFGDTVKEEIFCWAGEIALVKPKVKILLI